MAHLDINAGRMPNRVRNCSFSSSGELLISQAKASLGACKYVQFLNPVREPGPNWEGIAICPGTDFEDKFLHSKLLREPMQWFKVASLFNSGQGYPSPWNLVCLTPSK